MQINSGVHIFLFEVKVKKGFLKNDHELRVTTFTFKFEKRVIYGKNDVKW